MRATSLRWLGVALVLGVVVTLGFSSGCGSSSPAPQSAVQTFIPHLVTFCQYDYQNFGGDPTNPTAPIPPLNAPNSPFGGALVQFNAPPGMYFLNSLIQNGTTEWQIENLPLISPGGQVEFRVPIALDDFQAVPNENVPFLNHATELTTLPLPLPPTNFLTAPVLDYLVEFQTGIQNAVVPVPDPPSQPFKFAYTLGSLFSYTTGGHAVYTNQECGRNECGPAAVSNSLKTIGVGTDAQNSIAACKGLTGWTAGGVPANWPVGKGAATAGAPYNLTTTVHKPGATAAERIQLFCDILDALAAGKDVEVDNPTHVAMVVSATKVTIGGTTYYVLNVAHDTSQGAAGGVVTEPLFYDPASNKFFGGTAGFFHNSILDQFTIEAK
ncbi:MAG: hypothetical protein O2894_00990 [Planctomycetota bacterium]|nr:hypothetical protein [Planctomycetota bacterium]